MKKTLPILAAALLAALSLGAAERRPLPVFELKGPGGVKTPSNALSTANRWVLIYVKTKSVPCDRLLQSMAAWKIPQSSTRTALVIGDAYEDAARYAEGKGFPWYADDEAMAWESLQLRGVPVLLGIEGGKIAWTLAGVLNDPAALESILRTWLTPPAEAKP
jgi:hypothetical protein